MLQLGWKAGPEQFEPNALLNFAVAAEQAGFDLIEASDHFNPWSDDGQACFTWTWLGAMAPGRAFLSVGTGEALNEYAATGAWPDCDERQVRMHEAIDLIRELWKGDPVTFDGAYYETHKARLYTLPHQPVPLYISAMIPESASFAGAYGDGLITVGGKSPDVYEQILRNFADGARQAGKDPAQMRKLIEVNAAFTDDVETTVAEMKKYWAGTFIPALFDQNIYTPAMSAENGEPIGADTITQQMVISTNADEHVKAAQQYIDLGFDVLIYHSAQEDQRAFIEGFEREVLPRLRQR